jgi:quinol monooxygenase YgiN
VSLTHSLQFGSLLAFLFENRVSYAGSQLAMAVGRTVKASQLILESVRIRVTPTKREQLRRALAAWAGPAEVEPGCLSCRILQEDNDPQTFYFEARWKTQDDLLRHLRADHYKRLLVLMELGSGPPLVEFHTVAGTAGLELIQRVRNARPGAESGSEEI